MNATPVAEGGIAAARAYELRSRAAEARRAALATRKQSEAAFDRTAAILIRFDGRPFGDLDGRRFLLHIGRARPLVRFVRHDLQRWLERAGLPADAVSEVTLACSEACANAVEHPDQARRQLVEIEAALEGTDLELRIRDFGAWKEQTEGSPLRGRGLDMIGDLMDRLDVQRTPHGTELVMRRSFAP